MKSVNTLAISVSRQFGSGGGVLASRLAKRLGFKYMDREIVIETARKMGVTYQEIASFDEKSAGFWKSVLYACRLGDHYYTPAEHIPSDTAIHDVESQIILDAVSGTSVVVVGRGANVVLQHHPGHLSLFFHASEASRLKRVCEISGLGEEDARLLMQRTEAGREEYIRRFCKQDVYDLRQYDLAVNTDLFSADDCEEVLMDCIRRRFGPGHPALAGQPGGHHG